MKLFKTKAKEQWYSSKEIDKTKATYRLIIGQRSNGKTYDAIKKVIREYFKTGIPSVYIRRFAEDIMPKNLTQLMTVHIPLIEELSNGRYNNIVYRAGEFHLANINDEGKTIVKDPNPILFTAALNNWERSKGADRGVIKYFIFDEFMTRARYLDKEFTIFSNVHSTFVRNREGVITYMIANTVNKFCPYFEEMGLADNIEKMKQGQICIWEYNDDRLTVAVEYCLESKKSEFGSFYYAFNNPTLDMIRTGSWEEDSYPHLEKGMSINEDNITAKFYVKFNHQVVIGKIISDDHNLFIFFHKAQLDLKELDYNDIVFVSEPTTYTTWFHQFSDCNLGNLGPVINLLIKTGKVYYSTNAVGEIVRNFMLNKFTPFGGKY